MAGDSATGSTGTKSLALWMRTRDVSDGSAGGLTAAFSGATNGSAVLAGDGACAGSCELAGGIGRTGRGVGPVGSGTAGSGAAGPLAGGIIGRGVGPVSRTGVFASMT